MLTHVAALSLWSRRNAAIHHQFVQNPMLLVYLFFCSVILSQAKQPALSLAMSGCMPKSIVAFNVTCDGDALQVLHQNPSPLSATERSSSEYIPPIVVYWHILWQLEP